MDHISPECHPSEWITFGRRGGSLFGGKVDQFSRGIRTIDALSLFLCGLPAIALAGTEGKPWLPDACHGRRVLLALDADVAGDRGSEKLAALLAGAQCWRLRPEGAKDWNEALCQIGLPALRRSLGAKAHAALGASDLAPAP